MRKKPATLKTRLHRQTKAVSKIISVLLMIAIAIAAALVAYAWMMGYLGGTTQKTEHQIQIPNVQPANEQGSWLTIYVQNTGKGLVHVKQDSSVYVNDILHKITHSPKNNETDLAPGELLPLLEGQTRELEIDH